MIKDIAHIALNPMDMDKTVAYFDRTFGWKKVFELHKDNGDPWIVYIKICKGHFLELFYDGLNDRDYAFDFKKTGYNHLCITVGDIRKTLQEMFEKGLIDSAEPELEKSGCKDLEASLDFYCNKLGFKLVGIQNNDNGEPWLHYVRIKDGVYLELIPNGEGENPNTGWNSRGFQHLCLETDDLMADVERLRAIGVQIDQEPKTAADLNWQAWIHDPDGNKIELMMINPESPQAKA